MFFMIKIILPIILIISSLLSYEISLDKPSTVSKKVLESKEKITLKRDDAKNLVIDKNTGLMWQDDLNAKTIRKNHKDAKQYCRSLVFAGYDDWYLPRVKELKSITDITKHNPSIKKGFKNIVSGHYWTSSPNLSDTVNVINVDFMSGHSYHSNRKGQAYVRCCRGKYNTLI